jgi:hypothetical protein
MSDSSPSKILIVDDVEDKTWENYKFPKDFMFGVGEIFNRSTSWTFC